MQNYPRADGVDGVDSRNCGNFHFHIGTLDKAAFLAGLNHYGFHTATQEAVGDLIQRLFPSEQFCLFKIGKQIIYIAQRMLNIV